MNKKLIGILVVAMLLLIIASVSGNTNFNNLNTNRLIFLEIDETRDKILIIDDDNIPYDNWGEDLYIDKNSNQWQLSLNLNFDSKSLKKKKNKFFFNFILIFLSFYFL